MAETRRLLGVIVCGAAACGRVQPATPADGATGDGATGDSATADGARDGAPDGPVSHTVRVSTTGDDASDGFVRPVKTLKRAFALAVADGQITRIDLASGNYSAANGETYPYVVPANLTISGNNAKLVGDASVGGLVLESGTIEGIELSEFATAVTATGTVALTDVHIQSSNLGVLATTAAKLTITRLDITGAAGACATGISAQDTAAVSAAQLRTTGLGASLEMVDQSTVELTSPTLTGVAACTASMLSVSGKTLAITSGQIQMGATGIAFAHAAPPTVATVTDTAIAFMSGDGMIGSTVALTMTGGNLRGSNRGLFATGGSWTFTNVAIIQNRTTALEVGGTSPSARGSLLAHGCDISGNGGDGILLSDFGVADLGTAANPGNNQLRNGNINLDLAGAAGAALVTAIGNTWRPSTQGSDTSGRYPQPATIIGPVAAAPGNNFALVANWSLVR